MSEKHHDDDMDEGLLKEVLRGDHDFIGAKDLRRMRWASIPIAYPSLEEMRKKQIREFKHTLAKECIMGLFGKGSSAVIGYDMKAEVRDVFKAAQVAAETFFEELEK